MTRTAIIAAALASIALTAPAAHAQRAVSYEEELARREQGVILTHPLAGRDNNLWHDYQTDVAEARQELRKDLDDVSDSEDRRDAWEEYRSELADARYDYVKEMKEKGYRVGQVRLEP
ncbi:hypothetical protein C1T17_05585 [Sphingobium sp. SCG-1]|uniref:hypothetical protein n=1 Tax=Sphingobium sp. SCG-1 TaxID=2072936 RepID=UPI000CD68644|nr:hypothetical protein [Sphingobium sp. SCG-1]AUW57653.1 hypothetical protein C1T17_05585 [Sphingobium sp. SCG-1]